MPAKKESPFVRVEKEARRKPRLLPPQDERRYVTVFMCLAMNLKFRVLALVEHRTDSELMAEAVQEFLDAGVEPEDTRQRPTNECRITFVMTKETKARIDGFAREKKWTKSDIVAIALSVYLKKKGINPYTDPNAKIWEALKS